MLKPIKDSDILKRYSSPPGDPPGDTDPSSTGSISIFPVNPLDLPSETFENAIKRREQNHQMLIQWIRQNLGVEVHYGRLHIFEQCPYAKAGIAHQCNEFSHYSGLMLFKAGAEKIIAIMGLTAHFPTLHQFEMACVHRQEITQILLKCELKTQNGTVVAEGSGARHIRQDGWKLNTSIKMAQKSALIDATIRVAGLTGVFIKTHRHTVKKNLSRGGNRHRHALPPRGLHNSKRPEEKPITDKQKHLILRLSGRKGLTTKGLERLIQKHFNKSMEDLGRVEASRFIQHIN